MSMQSMQEKILEFMRSESYAPMSAEEMIFAIPVKEDPQQFWDALLALQTSGDIVKTRFDTFGLPEKMGLVVGRMQVTSKGFGFVIPDNKGDKPDVFISPRLLGGAMNNDRVMARINSGLGGVNPEGEIIRIITHANSKVVGIFKQTGDFAFVVPDDKRIGRDIYVVRRNFGGAHSNQKVVVEITEWPTERRNAEGKIIEVLGTVGDVGLEILSIIKQKDLPLNFPKVVVEASLKVPKTIAPSELQGRVDRRKYNIITVDGDDAKDFDDAVFAKKLDANTFFLGVYIADVSYYVKENMPLDLEARERGTSVYLVDRVLPMLPERLSNGICSLNEGEDRLVMACEMHIDAITGKIKKYDLFPSVICSHHRMTYNKVRKILEDSDPELTAQYADILPMLKDMEELCHVLQKKRANRGAIDFDLPEQKVVLDEDGKPLEIIPRVRSVAESIIEEFMLSANETVARHLAEHRWPLLYRVHDVPAAEKMQSLSRLLHNFNVNLYVDEDNIKPIDVQRALKQMVGRPEERLINTVALRCMRQAVYQTENVGHFGLAAEYYTHFTSPIRRYPDLIIHRLLHRYLQNPAMSEEKFARITRALDTIGAHASMKERDAADAERETVNLKKAEYMVGHIGEEFDGVISGVTAYGMYVELENGVEGMVHISSLTDDYYEFFEEKYALMGTHTNKLYRLGDKVRIEVLQVNLAERNIDFIMAGENEAMRDYIKQRLSATRHRPKNGGSENIVPSSWSEDNHKKGKKGKIGKRKDNKRKEMTGTHKKRYAKRGKGGIGGNKYWENSHSHSKRHKNRHK
jgi:ribonuclease R